MSLYRSKKTGRPDHFRLAQGDNPHTVTFIANEEAGKILSDAVHHNGGGIYHAPWRVRRKWGQRLGPIPGSMSVWAPCGVSCKSLASRRVPERRRSEPKKRKSRKDSPTNGRPKKKRKKENK
ncbi:hypothetical protein PCH_Pc18g05840 [Penicillium rubens Wisconsin 54-1255]|uniref:Uncharacterized protein n=1 Tax=Penicillium rubens (strain ATCC 28089 / DSM 1075 / NRRL 1951 / Wisconsin 54-1255) TaxID=500485 RepID=B6HCD0_PENRW|nr:hypothetical protein PCH_Pc18g05840 [Penicillium rubens Wisconsin 54-1255]